MKLQLTSNRTLKFAVKAPEWCTQANHSLWLYINWKGTSKTNLSTSYDDGQYCMVGVDYRSFLMKFLNTQPYSNLWQTYRLMLTVTSAKHNQTPPTILQLQKQVLNKAPTHTPSTTNIVNLHMTWWYWRENIGCISIWFTTVTNFYEYRC